MLEGLQQPLRFHAAVVHLPIAVGVLGFLLVLMRLVTGGRSNALRWGAILIYAVGAGTALLAVRSGEALEDHHLPATITDAAYDAVHAHEKAAEPLWIAMLVPLVLLMLSQIPKTMIRVLCLILALLSSLVLGGWVAYAGHLGGSLVYEHGLGVPTSPNNHLLPLTPPPATDETDVGEREASKSETADDAQPTQ